MRLSWVPVAVLVASSSYVAWREGGGADARPAPPEGTVAPRASATAAPGRLPCDVLWLIAGAQALQGPTPGLDRLAARGVRFSHAWSAAMSPRDARPSMLAGQRPGELEDEPPLVTTRLGRLGAATATVSGPREVHDFLEAHAGARFALVADVGSDAALGAVLEELDALGRTATTLVIATADHGGGATVEARTRVPLVLALPGVLDGGRTVDARVLGTDVAPTVLDLEGLEADPRMSGRSLLPLARGVHEPQPRVVVSEGRGARAILWDHFRLVVHAGGPDELYDEDADPGERRSVARAHPDVVDELRARLAAALANVPAADAKEPESLLPLPVVHLRFAGAGRARKVSGSVTAGDGRHGVRLTYEPVNVARDAARVDGPTLTFAFTTAPDTPVGLDLRVDPPGAPLAWTLALDDAPWPDGATFSGPWGLPAAAAHAGLDGDEARAEASARTLPFIDPATDLGLFVTRDPRCPGSP